MQLQFQIAARELASVPMAIEKMLGRISQEVGQRLHAGGQPTAHDAMVASAQLSGAMKSHAQQKLYVGEAMSALSNPQLQIATDATDFIMTTASEIARVFGAGGAPAAFSNFGQAAMEFAALTAPAVGRATYALEAVSLMTSKFAALPVLDKEPSPRSSAQLGGQTIAIFEQALSRMVGTGRMLSYSNELNPDLANQMRGFIASSPDYILREIADITKMAGGTIKNFEALSGPSGDELRQSLLGH
jgi:hypothetical protein